MGTFRMPSLGADMETGRLVEWLVAPGTAVRRGDVVAVVETQKGAIEIEVFEDGVLAETLVEPDTDVPVGTPIAEIRSAGDAGAPPPLSTAAAEREPAAAAAPRARTEATPVPLPAAADVPPAVPPVRPPQPSPGPPRPPVPFEPPAARPEAMDLEAGGTEAEGAQMGSAEAGSAEAGDAKAARPRASPAARRRAAETGVALASLTGTGPEGAIVFADVERAAGTGSTSAASAAGSAEAPTQAPQPPSDAAKPGPAPAPEPAVGPAPRRGLDMGEMRKAIAAAMTRSKREIPHFYLEQKVALTAARARLDALNDERPPAERLLPAVLFIKATALALARHPAFNGHYVDGAFRPAERVHLGTAVAVRGGGLIAPAIHDADRLDLDGLMARLKDLVARVRSGGLRGSELTDPTATLTSLGDRGVETVWGVIHPPQVAMIGAGRPFRRPWAEGDALAVREVVSLTLAADHRVADGHAGALFLAEIGRLLETPEEL